MRRLIQKIELLCFILLLTATISFGAIASYEGGALGNPTLDEGRYEYSEYFFLSGEPILLTGYVEIPDENTNDNYTETYAFELSNADENILVDRSITYQVTNNIDNEMNQKIYKREITDIQEDIEVAGNEYTLGSYTYDHSRLVDMTPAVDYYSGNVNYKKIYYLNGNSVANDGKLTHNISSVTDIGYDHYWGSSETLVLDHELTFTDENDENNWTGYYTTKNSSINQKRFQYNTNDPINISFRGSYVKSSTMENIVQSTYNLPDTQAGINDFERNQGEENITQNVTLDYQSLLSPKIKDIGGHWAEEEIVLLRALGIFDNNNEYFAPNSQMNRLMFGKAIANALAEIEDMDLTDRVINNRNNDGEIFFDVDGEHPDYEHIKFLKDRKIMIGEYGYFKAYRPVSRAEAVKVLINALGLESLAPMPPYRTTFTDDEAIPNWARDAVYVANEIGLISGYPDGTFRGKTYLTKADATAMIMNFINHIKDNITYDYRERIINKY